MNNVLYKVTGKWDSSDLEIFYIVAIDLNSAEKLAYDYFETVDTLEIIAKEYDGADNELFPKLIIQEVKIKIKKGS